MSELVMCPKCGHEKQPTSFGKNAKMKKGRLNICRACNKSSLSSEKRADDYLIHLNLKPEEY